VIQICDRGHNIFFRRKGCETRREDNGKLVASGIRTFGNLYTLIETSNGSYFLGHKDESW